MSNKRILVCEDEEAIREFVVINLKRANFDVIETTTGEQALEEYTLNNGRIDIVLLDIMLPGMDGFEVCRMIRAKSGSVGIIMLSAKLHEDDKITGLSIGADDYITKPFSPSELIARIEAVSRRISQNNAISSPANNLLISGVFILNPKSRTVTKSGTLLDLTQVEYQIMECFLSNKDVAMDRQAIQEKIWGSSSYGDLKIVDVNIRRLRMKIEDEPSKPVYIQTIWGYGYKWCEQQ